MAPLSHETVRSLIKQYRARAEEFCAAACEQDHALVLSVTSRAHVQVLEDGAFVEVTLWVPKGDL